MAERPGTASLDLAPHVPSGWLGAGWEVHDLPTGLGRLGCALRWHGERPALLWDLETDAEGPVLLTSSGLDPAWSSAERRGEALLAPMRRSVEGDTEAPPQASSSFT